MAKIIKEAKDENSSKDIKHIDPDFCRMSVYTHIISSASAGYSKRNTKTESQDHKASPANSETENRTGIKGI